MIERSNRRKFLKMGVAAAGLAGVCDRLAGAATVEPATGVSVRREPVAIAMWDFSWLLRHHPGGEFENWNAVLDGLVDRGYNAIRFDVFPALVAARSGGKTTETFDFPKNDWKPALWGNQYSTQINPRKALAEFIPRCLDRGLLLGLSTWFMGPGVEQIEGLDGFVRVWHETLSFLKENDLLHNVYYVDLLNEYPLFNGFTWFRRHLDGQLQSQIEKAKAGGAHEWKAKMGDYNDKQSRALCVGFADDAIGRLKKSWPQIDFLFSQTTHESADWRAMAPSKTAAIDLHTWFVMNPTLGGDTGYWEKVHDIANNDLSFAGVQTALLKNWKEHKPRLIQWMDQQMGEAMAIGQRHGKPVGNTEGWGLINWMDHPALTWDIIKEAGEICVGLGRKHGYRFLCTSNFTHPQFPRLWADVSWHHRLTGMIRRG